MLGKAWYSQSSVLAGFSPHPLPTLTPQLPLPLRSWCLASLLGSQNCFFPLSFTLSVAKPQTQHNQIQIPSTSPKILFPILWSLSCFMESPSQQAQTLNHLRLLPFCSGYIQWSCNFYELYFLNCSQVLPSNPHAHESLPSSPYLSPSPKKLFSLGSTRNRLWAKNLSANSC